MKGQLTGLNEIISKKIAELYLAEKKYIRAYAQLAATVYTDELKAALAPSGTEIESHISRLKQILDLFKQKPIKTYNPADEKLLELLKLATRPKNKASVLRDIDILQTAKMIIHAKIACYESLYLMTTAQDIVHVPMLLEQSLKDNRNTAGYLSQIEQNIIYPQLAKAD